MEQIPRDMELQGETVRLIPLETAYFTELCRLAADPGIWKFIPADMSDAAKCRFHFSKALEERAKGTQFPFLILYRKTNKIIGSTRLMDIQPAHRKLEIGWTWLHPYYWATCVNPECKLLLLSFCFERLNAIRVQLKTDEHNLRSRKAIEKIGGTYEGTLRQDMIRENGTIRSSAYFSLLDHEWPEKKARLEKLVQSSRSPEEQSV